MFVTGSTAPTSDVGPWLKNGTEWWVWDSVSGAYVSITIAQESLGYYIGSTTPDETIYQFWIQTTAPGSPLAVKIYYGGAWVDVYATLLATYQTVAAMAAYYTSTQTDSAIAAAVASIPSSSVGQGSFNANATAAQDLVFGGGGNQTGKVLYGTEIFDPDGVFAANEFIAPADGYYMFTATAYISVPAGAPTDVDPRFYITVAAGAVATLNDEAGPDATNGRGYVGATYQYLTAGQVVGVTYDVTVDAACTVRITAGYFNQLCGYRVR